MAIAINRDIVANINIVPYTNVLVGADSPEEMTAKVSDPRFAAMMDAVANAGASAKVVAELPDTEIVATTVAPPAPAPAPAPAWSPGPAAMDQQVAQQAAPVPAAPSQATPQCQHGAKTYKTGVAKSTGREWRAWMCPSPQGTPDQCAPDFLR